MRGFLKGIASGLVLALLLLGFGYGCERMNQSDDLARYRPPTELLTVDGHKMFIQCTGTGSPTVILEAGGLGLSVDWALVTSDISQFTRVCVYDRAGRGYSEAGPLPRTGEQIANELHALLGAAKVEGPLILVAHSVGTLYARIYTALYKADVAGLVLVDAAHEEMDHAIWDRLLSDCKTGLRLRPFGLLRLGGIFDQAPGLSPEDQERAAAQRYQDGYLETVCAEVSSVDVTVQQLTSRPVLLDVPLEIVSAGIFAVPAGFPISERDQMKTIWDGYQQKLLTLSPKAHQTVAEKSEHAIQLFEPDVVVAAVKRVFDARP